MVNRLVAPPVELPNSIFLDSAEIRTTKEGKNLHFLKILNAPVFRLELLFWTDLEQEPIKGVYSTIIGTFLKGTSQKSSSEIEEIFAQNGVFREFSTYTDHSSVVFYGLESKLFQTLELIQEILEEANFQPEEVRKYNKIRLENLRISKEKTSYWGSRVIKELVFGNEHIMGKAMEEEDYDTLLSFSNYNDLYRSSFLPSFDVVVTSSKDLNPDDVLPYFSQKHVKRRAVDFSNFEFKGNSITHQLKNSEQATIKLGFPLSSIHHPDFNFFKITNEIIGGYFGSRLNKVIREEKGLTYGIYSSIVPFQGGSFFSVTADVNKKAAEEALQEVIQQIKLLKKDGLDIEEFNLVINNLKGSTLSDINNPFHISEKYRTSLNLGNSTTEIIDFYDFISRLDLEQLNDFIKNRFPFNVFSSVIVT